MLECPQLAVMLNLFDVLIKFRMMMVMMMRMRMRMMMMMVMMMMMTGASPWLETSLWW